MHIAENAVLAVYDRILRTGPWSPPGVSLIAARKMWPVTTGEHTVVAVLDTGVDYKHPDLAKNIIDGISVVPGQKQYTDDNGHGTHVAGIIAANKSLLGVAPGTKILVIKVFDKNGQGSNSNVARGIEWATRWRGPKKERVNVINLSLGGPIPNSFLYQKIIEAIKAGITVVCAAGNSGDGSEQKREISYPAYYKETISVGAVDLQSRIASFSNSNKHIDLVAPGVETYSTYPGNRYVKLSGTSMATPHISGSVALIYSRWFKRFGKYPSPEIVNTLLQYQSIDLGKVGFDELYGYGLFSFNPDGGKAIMVTSGEQYCEINRKQYPLPVVPSTNKGQMCGSYNALAEILGYDALFIPAGSEDNQQDLMQIWC
jgi:major intracellular serine protease